MGDSDLVTGETCVLLYGALAETRWNCGHLGIHMVINNTQISCGIQTMLDWFYEAHPVCAKKTFTKPLDPHYQPKLSTQNRLGPRIHAVDNNTDPPSACWSRNQDSSDKVLDGFIH